MWGRTGAPLARALQFEDGKHSPYCRAVALSLGVVAAKTPQTSPGGAFGQAVV